MAKTKGQNGKNTGTKNDKLKTMRDLPPCMVVLNNIAFDKDLVKLHKLRFLEKKKEKLRHSSQCSNTSKNSSNVWMLKEEMQEDNTVDEISRSEYITRSRLRKLNKNENKECKDLRLLSNILCKPELILPGFVVQGQQLNCDTSVRSFSSKSNDEDSSISLNTHCSYTQEVVPTNIKKHDNNRRSTIQKKNRVKRKLYFDKSEIGTSLESVKINSDSESHLDEKKVTNYNSKMQKISNEDLQLIKLPRMEFNTDLLHQKYDKLETVLTTERGGKSKLEQRERIQTVKALFSNLIDTNVENKISKTSENIKTNSKNVNLSDNFLSTYNINESQNQKDTSTISSDLSLTTNSTIQTTDCSESILNPFFICPTTPTVPKTKRKVPKRLSDFLTNNNNEIKQHTNKTNNTKKNLPKITQEHILPKGTIKIIKVSANNGNLQNNFSEQIFLGKKKYDTNNSIKQVSCVNNTLDSTNILKGKVSESTPSFNNNINLKNKNIDNKLQSTKIDHKDDFFMEEKDDIYNVNANDVDSETIYEDNISIYQEQSNKFDNEERENNIIQNNKNSETNSNESILKNNSNLMDINKSCNDNRLSIFGSKEEVIKRNRKRIAEKNVRDIKMNNKKKRLNRTIWLQNSRVTCTKLNQQFDDFSSIDTVISTDTVKSNIAKENYSKNQDLRELLNKKKSKPTSENEFNNKNSVESKQIHSDIENDISTSTNTKIEEFCKGLSFNEKTAFNKTYTEKDIQTDPICNNHIEVHCHSTSESTSEETQHISQIDGNTYEDTNIQKECRTDENNSDDGDNSDDGISLFAESFDTNFYEKTLGEQKKPSKSLHSDVPYLMTVSSFDKFVKQNATEFNKEYAKYEENSIEMANKSDSTKKEFNNQSERAVHTDCVLETRTALKEPFGAKNVNTLNYQPLRKYFYGYCFQILRNGNCYRNLSCRYRHNFLTLVNTIYEENPQLILSIIKEAIYLGFPFICTTIFIKSLPKLTVDQILIMFEIFHNIDTLKELAAYSKRKIAQNTVNELLNRQMSLKTIVDCLMKYIPSTNSEDLANLLIYVEKEIKCEYWNTVRTLVLKLLQINKFVESSIIHKILTECIENKDFTNIKDVNDNLINKISHTLISTLDKDLIESFKSLLTDKTANNSAIVQNFGKNISELTDKTANNSAIVQNFGQNISELTDKTANNSAIVQNFGQNISETIASPDGNTNLSETESPPKRSSTVINKSRHENMDHITKVNGEVYTLRRIDNLPEARSIYRDHEHLWKFFVDLERFKKGLLHHDYDYVIHILKSYSEAKQDETSLFTRSCCSILRTEVKRSEYHLTNIIRRTVQMDIFNILGKMLFNIGLDVLTNLVDQEAWGLALWLIRSLDMYNLPYNAGYFLLSAEIYLANKKAIKAYDLLKHQNILCTSRDKWYVTSTINDEHVRSKIMYILLDSFCNELIDYAFFLFQFLLKDQSSQYDPIDLSCYVDKLIILFLSKKDTNLIIEMADTILKYTFALNATTCRALISTLIHLDENLARQIYSYAEGIGIYPKMKLWPVTYIIINNDLTEEEIYLTFVQLLKNLVINFGHAIEFAKPHQIKVYLILEIKSVNAQFYCAELQSYYNNKIITNVKALIRNVLKKRFDPPILLMSGSKGRIYKLQSTSVINYLKTEHCN